MSKNFLQIHPNDNILAALQDMKKDFVVEFEGKSFPLKNNVSAKHKFALQEFKVGDPILMYGALIGKATKPIAQGESITIDNVVHASADYNVGEQQSHWVAPDISKWKNSTFNGYHRADGTVGTANHWLVIPMVFCENRNVNVLRSTLLSALGYETAKDFIIDTEVLISQYKKGASAEEMMASPLIKTAEDIKQNRTFPNVDGIKFLTHDGGCGCDRGDSDTLCNLLAGYITNPNVAGLPFLVWAARTQRLKFWRPPLPNATPTFPNPCTFWNNKKVRANAIL